MNTTLENTPLDFALLGHPESYDHLSDLWLHSRPDYGLQKLQRHKATLAKFFEWTPVYASPTPLTIPRTGGQPLSGRVIVCTFLPETVDSPQQMLAVHNKTREGCRLARAMGAKVVGLGGFTSVAGGAQGEALAREFGVAITSGNTLTAALALAQLDELLDRLGWSLGDRTAAVLGATGDIGRACTLSLARRVRRVILIARSQAKLRALREALISQVDVRITTDAEEAVEASIILAATSSPHPILSEADLRPGTIVADIGYPKNLSTASVPRPDVLIFAGGLANMPFALDISLHTRLPSPSVMYGCFSEAMLMALTGRYASGSMGPGSITPETMGAWLALAQAQGFKPAPWYRGKHLIGDQALESFLRLASQPE